MLKKLFLSFVFFGSTLINSPSLSSENPAELGTSNVDNQIFLKMSESSSLFSSLPVFNHEKDMAYLDENSQNEIRAVAWNFHELSVELDVRIIGQRENAVGGDNQSSTQDELERAQTIKKYKVWQKQLIELQNACCFFLSNKDYGHFFPQLDKILKSGVAFPEAKWLPIEFSSRPSYPDPSSLLSNYVWVPLAGYGMQLVISSIEAENSRDFNAIFLSHSMAIEQKEKGEVASGYFPQCAEQFQNFDKMRLQLLRLKSYLKVRSSAKDKALGFGGSVISGLASELDLNLEFYSDFKKIRNDRINEYKNPPLSFLSAMPAQDVIQERIDNMRRELILSELLISAEKIFLQAMDTLSDMKLKYWQSYVKSKIN